MESVRIAAYQNICANLDGRQNDQAQQASANASPALREFELRSNALQKWLRWTEVAVFCNLRSNAYANSMYESVALTSISEAARLNISRQEMAVAERVGKQRAEKEMSVPNGAEVEFCRRFASSAQPAELDRLQRKATENFH